jgi:hypothetical protein
MQQLTSTAHNRNSTTHNRNFLLTRATSEGGVFAPSMLMRPWLKACGRG